MLTVDNETIETDFEGYLFDPDAWSIQACKQMAEDEQLILDDEYWEIIFFMRKYYDEHKVAPDTRHTIMFMRDNFETTKKVAHNRLFRLFPFGYVKQACKIAGMKKPRAWSSG